MRFKIDIMLIAVSIMMLLGIIGLHLYRRPSVSVIRNDTDIVLRDPFRPDHPTRAEWEASKR